MTDFKRFALDASNGAKTLIFSHSQVETFTYCTTEECADNLTSHIGATSTAFTGTGLGNVQFYRKAIKGKFQIWGELGSDAPAHSQHLQYMGQFLDDLPLSHVPEPSVGILLAPIALGAPRRTPFSFSLPETKPESERKFPSPRAEVTLASRSRRRPCARRSYPAHETLAGFD
jgi:hypothetical protein